MSVHNDRARGTMTLTPPTSPRIQEAFPRDFLYNSPASVSDDRDGLEVRLPDLFACIMSIDPAMNSHYQVVKLEADAWIAR